MDRETLLKILRGETKESSQWDTEQNHIKMDDALLEYINDEEITDAFNAVPKWYA